MSRPHVPALARYPLRALLLEIERRGIAEMVYTTIGTDMAIGARSLLDQLPASMLDWVEPSS